MQEGERMDWSEAGAGAGGGILVALVSWFLGRSDTAAERRRNEIRAVAKEVYSETGHDARLRGIEVSVANCEKGVDEVKATVGSVNDKLDQLLLGGRIPIK